jgi:hypothetical protein
LLRRDFARRGFLGAAGMHEEAFSRQHSAVSQTGAKNHMFSGGAFVKDPSTSLRISLERLGRRQDSSRCTISQLKFRRKCSTF